MVGSKLNLKLLRDLRSSPWMFLGIVLLAAVGITLFGTAYELYLNLGRSYELSYEKLKLADFSIQMQSAPDDIVNNLRRIPGVRDVQGRTVQEIEIDQPLSSSKKVIGRIIGLPDYGKPAINQLKLISGTYPRAGNSHEVLMEAGFAEYHHYKPGDTINIVVMDEKIHFKIVGVVQSPEYIYVVRSSEDSFSNSRTFGVMWARTATVDELFGTDGSINDVQVLMAPDGNRRTAMRIAERIMQPYGADEVVTREKQPSVEFLRLDLQGMQTLAVFFPILFLTISSLSIYNMLGRMVHAQRGQIGFLRAVGFSKSAIAVHYAQFSLIIGILSGLIGSLAGHYFGILTTRFYTGFIQVPYIDASPRWGIVAAGFISTCLVMLIAGILPAVHAANLAPADAIGIELPSGGRKPIFEKILPFLRLLSLMMRLPMRNFIRNPRRTFSTVAGVASALTLVLVAASMLDSSVAAIDFYFKHSMHYSAMASYLNAQSESTISQIATWKGVRRVEPALIVSGKFVKGDASKTVLIYGLRKGDRLFSLTDLDMQPIQVPSNGLMLANSTANRLGLWKGGRVHLTLPEKTMPELAELADNKQTSLAQSLMLGYPVSWLNLESYSDSVLKPSRSLLEVDMDRLVPIDSIAYEPVGDAAYASINQVRRWFAGAMELPPNAVNTVAIDADPKYMNAIKHKLYNMHDIAAVIVTKEIYDEIAEMMKSSRVFFYIMLSFSIALAGIIMFNSTLMNVIERTREIATLRTVGISAGSIGLMILLENLLAFMCGVIVGLPFGTWLAGVFVHMYDSESFSLQMVIFTRTYVIAVLCILITVLIAQVPGLRYIRKIELARATKDIG
ncbi:ABC transporter permease [bacterium]|nr:ABC transporter permease [bacterium]